MNVKSKNIKSNLQQIDSNNIKSHEYDELPELTDEMMDRAVYKGAGWQSHIGEILQKWIKSHPHSSPRQLTQCHAA